MKKFISAVAALAMGAGLALAAVAVPASADGGTTTIAWDQTHNQASYWTDYGPHDNGSCYKDSHGSVTNGGKAVTLPTFDPNWPGDHWELLVVKAGQQENVTIHPDAGVPYVAPDGKDVSHWIVCKGTTPEEQPVFDATAAVSITPATCTTPGSAQVTGLGFASLVGTLDVTPGAHSATFQAADGHKFPGNLAQLVVEYTVPGPDVSLCPTNVCAAELAGPTSTDLVDLWGNVDTRSAGHVEYVPGALHVWTDNNTSQAKVSEGYPASFALKNTGDLALNATANPGNVHPYGPGLNLFVDFDNNGTLDGTLVYEAVYGQDLWLTNGSQQFVKDNAPVVGGGNGSQWHGTINQWLTKFPDAQVAGIAYSLGSGVHGDWNITSIIAGCTEYRFDKVVPPTVPEPLIEHSYTEWTDGEYQCDDTSVTVTREHTITTTTYKLVVVEGQYQIVVDQVLIGEPVTETDTRQLDESEQITCVTPEVPIFHDPCGFSDDSVNLPDVEGVHYELEWSEDGNTATVTASAEEGYELVAEGEEELITVWTYTFTDEKCPVVITTPEPPAKIAETGIETTGGIIIAILLLAAGAAAIFTRRLARR